MSKVALLFPGQGSQYPGMGKDFYEQYNVARETYELASEVAELDVAALCHEENALLGQTAYTQIAMLTTEIAMLRTAKELGFKADVCAGLSLGEYGALAAAGVMSLPDCFRIIRRRGILMQEACPEGGGMMAVLGLTGRQVEDALGCCNEGPREASGRSKAGLQETPGCCSAGPQGAPERCDEKPQETLKGVYIANYNCPGQIVISGELAALEQAKERLTRAGAKRCIPLKVSGPFHSPMLKAAGEALYQDLKNVELQAPKIPYVTNVDATYVTETTRIKELLARQISESVRWQQSLERMLADGVDIFVEMGPGKTLRGFLRKLAPEAKCLGVETTEELRGVLEELAAQR